jgi:hypothetical protein
MYRIIFPIFLYTNCGAHGLILSFFDGKRRKASRQKMARAIPRYTNYFQKARLLNLHSDFVNHLYEGYLELVGLEDAVKLYHEFKQESIEVLCELAEGIKQQGIKPRNFGAATRYFRQYHQEGMKLEDIRQE